MSRQPVIPPTWAETKAAALKLHHAGADVPTIAAQLHIPAERVRDAIATSKGPRATAHGWPPAGHFTRTRNQGRAA